MSEVKLVEHPYGITLSVESENRIALSELSFIRQTMAIDYVSMVENHEAQIQLTDLIKKSQICLFFNRLNVPKKLRGRGLGGLLLKSTLHYCHKNRIFLINTANNYGEMGQDNLINFYEKYGMKLVHEEGLLVFHCDFV